MQEASGSDYQVDHYDRTLGRLDGLPDVVKTRATTVRVSALTRTETFVVQSFRQAAEGDLVALERLGPNGHDRLILPAKVVTAIVRQQAQLTTKSRRKAAKDRKPPEQTRAQRLRNLAKARKARTARGPA